MSPVMVQRVPCGEVPWPSTVVHADEPVLLEGGRCGDLGLLRECGAHVRVGAYPQSRGAGEPWCRAGVRVGWRAGAVAVGLLQRSLRRPRTGTGSSRQKQTNKRVRTQRGAIPRGRAGSKSARGTATSPAVLRCRTAADLRPLGLCIAPLRLEPCAAEPRHGRQELLPPRPAEKAVVHAR